jgi:hypothetical protein
MSGHMHAADLILSVSAPFPFLSHFCQVSAYSVLKMKSLLLVLFIAFLACFLFFLYSFILSDIVWIANVPQKAPVSKARFPAGGAAGRWYNLYEAEPRWRT